MHKNLPKQYYFIKKFDKKNLENQSKKTAIIYRNYSKKSLIRSQMKDYTFLD